MITYHNGDILESRAPIILHQVNCAGVMGAGLAKQIRQKYPSVYNRYRDFALGYDFSANQLLGFSLFTSINLDEKLPFIVNCFAQDEFGRDKVQTNYEALNDCFLDVELICRQSYDCCTIAIPDHIGCGLAGGDWSIVHEMICNVFADYPGNVQIWKFNK